MFALVTLATAESTQRNRVLRIPVAREAKHWWKERWRGKNISLCPDGFSCLSPVSWKMIVFVWRRGTALSLSFLQQWTQSQSSIVTKTTKVCVCLCECMSRKSGAHRPTFSLVKGRETLSLCVCVSFVFSLRVTRRLVMKTSDEAVVWGYDSCVCVCARVAGSQSLSSVAALEAPVICCLGPLIHYLREFNLEKVLLSDRYTHAECTFTHTFTHINTN